MPLTARIAAGITGVITRVFSHGGASERKFSYGVPIEFADGVGSFAASKLYAARLTIGASSNTDIDLSGTLVDDLGQATVFTAVKHIFVRPVSGPNPVVVGGAATNPFVGPFGAGTHTVSVPQGGALSLTNPTAGGWAVVATTGDLLRLANGAGGPIDVDVAIVGI